MRALPSSVFEEQDLSLGANDFTARSERTISSAPAHVFNSRYLYIGNVT